MELIEFTAIVVAGWLGTGYVTSAYFFAYFQREFSCIAKSQRAGDKRMALLMALFGPPAALGGVLAVRVWANMNSRKAYHGFDFGWLWA